MSTTWMRVPHLADVDWPADAVLICDKRVADSAPAALRDRLITVDAGERLKSLTAIEELAEEVLTHRSTRPLTIVAMGGGSVGDAVGFLASILWRGVELWHVPTTLLAAVDSAHGGKTAVNLGSAKNQLGTFWEASRTIFAESFLEKMPLELRAAGMTELIKGLWLGDAAALQRVDDVGVAALSRAPHADIAGPLGELLDAAVAVKHAVVARDPRETKGIRTWLNLGHTVAHGLELISGVSHGVAVAWGLACAAAISADRGLIDRPTRQRLWRHAYPLLGAIAPEPEAAAFLEAVARDKKTVDGQLRSVLLRGPGDPIVVDDVGAADWFDSLMRVREELFEAPVGLDGRNLRAARLQMSASKSELNRALVIAALRGDEPNFSADSDADDVRAMRAGIASIAAGEIADAKNGGTTFRFLTAIAVSTPGGGRIRVGEQLASRPHDGLLDALRGAGVAIKVDGDVFEFGPLPDGPLHFEVDASQSSQFASALQLLEAARDVELTITTKLASSGYFEMTRRMLELDPLDVTSDASSAAMWHVLNALGGTITLNGAASDLQPDTAIEHLLWEADQHTAVTCDLSECPDLAPVLAAYAVLTPAEVTLMGAPHLRHKESNRIDDLAAAFAEIGLEIAPRPDGLFIAAGVQRPTVDAVFDPRGDHRLAFAAMLLSTAVPLRLAGPRCVTKSYPDVFLHAWEVGFLVEPLLD